MELSSMLSDESGSVNSGISGIEPLNLSSFETSSLSSPALDISGGTNHGNKCGSGNVLLTVNQRLKKTKTLSSSTEEVQGQPQIRYRRPQGACVQLFKDEDLISSSIMSQIEDTSEMNSSGMPHQEGGEIEQNGDSSPELYMISPAADNSHTEDEDHPEEGIASPNFSLRPVMHDDIRAEVESSSDESSMHHTDQANSDGIEHDIQYSENTEADQYVMHPEVDQSEIGLPIQAAEGQSEPRPMAVGQTTQESEYQAAGSASEDEDDRIGQSDMPEDSFNFVSRQIEGEDEDEEDGGSLAGAVGGYSQPVYASQQMAHTDVTNSLHSPPANHSLLMGPLTLSGNEMQRHDLPQRVPPSGAADLTQIQFVPTSNSVFKPITDTSGSRSSSRTSSQSITRSSQPQTLPATAQVTGNRNGPAGAQTAPSQAAAQKITQKGASKKKVSSQGVQSKDKRCRADVSVYSDARGLTTAHSSQAPVGTDQRPMTSGSTGLHGSQLSSAAVTQVHVNSNIPTSSSQQQQQGGRPIMGILSLKPDNVPAQKTLAEPDMMYSNDDGLMQINHSNSTHMQSTAPVHQSSHHYIQQQHQNQRLHHQQQQPATHHVQDVQYSIQPNRALQLSLLQQQQQQLGGGEHVLQSSSRPHPTHYPPMYTALAPLEQTLEMSPVSYSGSQARGAPISPGASSTYDMLHNTSMTSTRSFGPSQSGAGQEISNMEQVRGQLQDMLRLTGQALPDKLNYDESERRGHDMMDSMASSAADVTSHLEDLLSMTTRQLGTSVHKPRLAAPLHADVASLVADNNVLTQSLEQEKYRRKHCEKQIHDLQNKMLELQQQLAVAVSTDRKKDLMIEQLDKNLAKVMDGWKKKEAEREERLAFLTEENSRLATKHASQAEMLRNFEQELAASVSQLQQEQERAQSAESAQKQQIEVLEMERRSLKSSADQQKSRLSSVEKELFSSRDSNERLGRQLTQLQEQYDVEHETWEEKEQEYVQKVEQITENHLQKMEESRVLFEEQVNKNDEMSKLLSETQTTLQVQTMELDAALREKESLKVEIGILEAKHEASLRAVRSELQAESERTMAERLEEVGERYRSQEEQTRDRHRQQMHELNQHHAHEMHEQLNRFHDDARRQDDKWRCQTQEFEERIQSLEEDLHLAKEHNESLDLQRQEITNKLQQMMQAHCNETLRLLQLGSQALPPSFKGQSVYSMPQSLSQSVSSSAADVVMSSQSVSTQPHNTSLLSAGGMSWMPSRLDVEKQEEHVTKDKPALSVSVVTTASTTTAHSFSLTMPTATMSTSQSLVTSSSHSSSSPSQSQSHLRDLSNAYSYDISQTSSREDHYLPSQDLTQPSQYDSTSRPPKDLQSSSSTEHEHMAEERDSIMVHPPVQSSTSGLNSSLLSSGSPQEPASNEGEVVRDKFTLSLMESLGTTSWDPASYDVNRTPRGQSGFLSSILQQDGGNTPSSVSDSPAQEPERLLGSVEDRFEQHEHRQTELQHYIRLLLERSRSETAEVTEPEASSEPEAQPQSHKTKHVAFSKTTVVVPAAAPEPQPQSPPTNQQGVRSMLSPDQAGEISRLLGLYGGPASRDDVRAGGEEAELYSYLQTLQTRNEEIHSASNQSTPTRDVPAQLTSQSPPRSRQPLKGQGHHKPKPNFEGPRQVTNQPKQTIKIPTGEAQAPVAVGSAKQKPGSVSGARPGRQPPLRTPAQHSNATRKPEKKGPASSASESKPASKGVPKWK